MATAAVIIRNSLLAFPVHQGTPPALRLSDAAERAFIAAFLLTGSRGAAEDAILQTIECMNSGERSGEELIQGTIRNAIGRERIAEKPDADLSWLPNELHRVLYLPRYLRQCLVLRVLVGLTRQMCANLLQLDAHRVDEYTCAAMAGLPG